MFDSDPQSFIIYLSLICLHILEVEYVYEIKLQVLCLQNPN